MCVNNRRRRWSQHKVSLKRQRKRRGLFLLYVSQAGLKMRKASSSLISCIIYQPPVEWTGVFLSCVCDQCKGYVHTPLKNHLHCGSASTTLPLNKCQIFLIEPHSGGEEQRFLGPNRSLPQVKATSTASTRKKPISRAALSALNSDVSFRQSRNT